MADIRWGIIGCGDVAEKKSGPAFQKASGSQLVAVMRRNADLARDFAQCHQVPKWYADAQQLIADPQVDAVYIATPPNAHLQYALACALAGKPAYIEKPVGCSYSECQKIVKTFRKKAVPLFTAYYRRSQERFIKLKEFLDSQEIGQLRFVSVLLTLPPQPGDNNPEDLPWRVLPQVAGGGRFVDLASHALDILDFVFGPIAEVKGFAANQAALYPAEDLVSAVFRFSDGLLGTGNWCFTAGIKADQVLLVAERGYLQLGIFSPETILKVDQQRKEIFAFERPEYVEQPLIQTIVNELKGKGRCPSSGENALRTWKIMDTLLADYYAQK